MGEPSQDWIEDCTRWYGKPLTGQFGHWCGEWDYLPIDETTIEFALCPCFEESNDDFVRAREAAKARMDRALNTTPTEQTKEVEG